MGSIRAGATALGLTVAAASLVSPNDAGAQVPVRRARPWLGVSMDVDQQQPSVVVVKHVVRTSPADRAGIREGDRILRVDHAPAAQPHDVTSAIAGHAVGDAIDVAVLRNGHEVPLHVSLGPFPEGDEMIRMDHLGTFAPAWRGLEAAGGAMPSSMGALRGRVVLVDFWATWCGPCRVASPHLNDLQSRYGAQGLTVLGISAEATDEVSIYAQNMGLRFAVASDPHGQTTQAYTVTSLPTLFVIDKRGVVREIEVGYDSSRDAAIENLIRTLIAEPAPAE